MQVHQFELSISQFEIGIEKIINCIKEKIADIDIWFAVDMDYIFVINSKIMRIRVRGYQLDQAIKVHKEEDDIWYIFTRWFWAFKVFINNKLFIGILSVPMSS